MKAIKRTVAALLATLMLATSTSFTLAAETYTDKEAVVVAKVTGAGIMQGKDTGFAPADTLTRAEAAAIIVRMKDCEPAAKSMAGTTLFKDVAASHWASGYVNEASQLGIVKGVSATEFDPDREVTVAEFVTMAIRALGAGTLVDSQGVWPTNYINFANTQSLLKDVTVVYTEKASRMNAATIVANALSAETWVQDAVDTTGKITYKKSGKFLHVDVLNLDRYNDVMVTDMNLKDKELTVWTFDEDGDPEVIFTDVECGKFVDLASLKEGIAYDLWYDTDEKEIVAIWKAEDSKTKVYEFTEVKKISADVIKVTIDGKDEEFKLNDNLLAVYYNNGTYSALLDKENVSGTIQVKGKNVVTVYFYEYTNFGIVDEITTTKIKFVEADKQSTKLAKPSDIKYTDDSLTFNVVKNGKVIDIKDIEEGDAVLVYQDLADTDVYNLEVVSNTAEGEVTSIGSTYIKVDGTKYTLDSNVATTGLQTEKDVVLYINDANKVIAWDCVNSFGDYAMVKSIEAVNGRKGVDLEVVLVYADGTVSEKLTVDLEETVKNNNNFADENAVRAYFVGQSVADTDTVAGVNTMIKGDGTGIGIQGSLICYSVNGGKLEIAKDNTTDLDMKSFTSASAGKVTIGTKSYIAADNAKTVKYVIDKDTVIFGVKADDVDTYKAKVELLSIDDLKTMDAYTMDAYAVFAKEDKHVEYLVIDKDATTGTYRNAVEEKWYVVLDKASTKEDYKAEILVADVTGTTATYYTDETIAKLNVGKLTIDGEEVKELDSSNYDLTDSDPSDDDVNDFADTYLYENNDGIFTLYAVTAEDDGNDTVTITLGAKENEYVFAEDVLFIKVKNGEYVIGKDEVDEVKDIIGDEYVYGSGEEYATSTAALAAAKDDLASAKQVLRLVTYTNEDNVTEVIAVIYK